MKNETLEFCKGIIKAGAGSSMDTNTIANCNTYEVSCSNCPFGSVGNCGKVKNEHITIAKEYINKHEPKTEQNCDTEKTFAEVVSTIKKGEAYIQKHGVSTLKRIYMDYYGNIKFAFDGVAPISVKKQEDPIEGDTWYEVFTGVHNAETFVLEREQYGFIEAFVSYEKGIEIESCLSNIRFKKIDGADCFYNSKENKFTQVDTFIEFTEIRDKWYINNKTKER